MQPATRWIVSAAVAMGAAASLAADQPALAVNTPDQQVLWGRESVGELAVLRAGGKDQRVLVKKGDNLRIDWGWCYAAADNKALERATVGDGEPLRRAFAEGRSLPEDVDRRMPRAAPDAAPAMTDWYWTQEPRLKGFRARSVVGGVFMPMLNNPEIWRKWVSRAGKVPGHWAPLRVPGPVVPLVPTAKQEPVTWRYTFQRPADDWFRPEFDDSKWREGPAGFGGHYIDVGLGVEAEPQ